jgi:N-acetylglucosamine-6-phosphate deacetylase
LILITDSNKPAGTNLTECITDNMEVYVGGKEGYTCYIKGENDLMGTSLTINKAAMLTKKFTNCSTEDIIRMGATNPAKLLEIEKSKGSISVGKDADLIMVKDEIDFDVELAMVEGKCITI